MSLQMLLFGEWANAPIDTLPLELLSYIFELTVHSTELHGCRETGIDANTVIIPSTLASVSKYWRRVARNTPGLWTSLCASVGSIHEYEFGPHTIHLFNPSHFALHLSLSKNHPLDIVIDARDPDYDFREPDLDPDEDYTPPFTPPHIRSAIRHILPHAARWRSLSIYTDCWSPLHAAIELLNPLVAPQLKCLTVMRCNDYVSFAPQFEPESLFLPLTLHPATTASLRHLTLRGVPAAWETVVASRLQSLDVSAIAAGCRPSFHEIHAILSECAETLTSLRILNEADHVPDQNLFLRPIALPRLTRLHLDIRSDMKIGLMQSGLFKTPTLRELMLEGEVHPFQGRTPNPRSTLAHFQDFALDKVTFKRIFADPDVLYEFLRDVGAAHVTLERAPDVDCLKKGRLGVGTLLLVDCEKLDVKAVKEISWMQADALKRIDVYVNGADDFEGINKMDGVVVIHRSSESSAEEIPLPQEEDAYRAGGPFNDPVFDALYKPVTSTR